VSEIAPQSILSWSLALSVAAILAVYYLLPHRWQNAWLLIVSYLCCLAWAWQAAALLFALTATNFTLALQLGPAARGRGGWLAAGVGLNILALAAFRITDFFVLKAVGLMSQLGIPTGAGALQIFIPIGLAFYSLQGIAYLAEVYRGQMPATHRFTDFALYLAYFPKLVAGPLERPQPFMERLARPRVVDNAGLARSLALIAVGAGRKLLIADTLAAAIPAHVWVVPSAFSGPELLAWLVIFAFSLYSDFAGYTSLARGVSGLFGIELAANFNAPFLARSFSEFWNRWHISLSHWLRDYIYFPLSRMLLRRNTDRQYWVNIFIPPMTTMVVSGLWHGLSWHMLVWGGLHGLYQVVERLMLKPRFAGSPAEWPKWRQAAGMLGVFLPVTLAWVPFKLELPAALAFWHALLNWTGFDIQHRRLLVALAILVPAVAFDWMQQLHQDDAAVRQWPRLAQATLLAVTVLLLWIVTAGDPPLPFIYQGF
jgi:alginate O-acetyltransferase complex protein AlgI